jgi:CRP-like cAMP-binding protein
LRELLRKSEKISNFDEIHSIINQISIFGALPEYQTDAVLKKMEKIRYGSGELIFRQGDPPSHIYVVKKGLVNIILEKNSSRYQLAALDVGNCFGETSVIGIQPHSASAYSSGETELIVLSRTALFSFYNEDPKLFSMIILNIAREACRRLNRTDNLLLDSYEEKNEKNDYY